MKKINVSILLNLLIVILVLLGTIFMLLNIKFMSDTLVLADSGINMFMFYTVDSNILVGIASLILVFMEIRYINKNKSIPRYAYILKYIGTVGVSITFLVTALYLAPISKSGYLSLYQNSNLLFHLIVPILSIISYIFYEGNMAIKNSLLGVISVFIYGIFYVVNIIIHLENGVVSRKYDFYYFVNGGVISIIFTFVVMILFAYLVSYIIWKLNRRLYNE